MHDLLTILVRSAHTAGMALMLGGAALLWAVTTWDHTPVARSPNRLPGLAAYERLFWLALGLQVMTGIGNLGALGLDLPGPGTPWGGRLLLKLLAVLAFALFSLVRTLVIARLGSAAGAAAASSLPGSPGGAAGGPHPLAAARLLPALYGLTTLSLAAIMVLAVALAHA
jgi:hypothetical protein